MGWFLTQPEKFNYATERYFTALKKLRFFRPRVKTRSQAPRDFFIFLSEGKQYETFLNRLD